MAALKKRLSWSVTENFTFPTVIDLSQWLQSHQQVQLFDKLFVRCDPIYLRQTSPLVILSVGAAVTSSLHTNIMERLVWLESVLRFIDARVRLSSPNPSLTHS